MPPGGRSHNRPFEPFDKSLARSDDQLAYYVGQAREIIELSIVSQKQIIDELQHAAAQRAGAEA